MKLTLSISSGNAAFEPSPRIEFGRILRACAEAVENGQNDGSLRDVNGNKVGSWNLDK